MKKKYTAPTAQVEEFDLKDVVMADSTSSTPVTKMVSSYQATRFDDE